MNTLDSSSEQPLSTARRATATVHGTQDQVGAGAMRKATADFVGRQPIYFAIQFGVWCASIVLLLAYARHNRCAALKGNATASRRTILPALESVLWIVCSTTAIYAVFFTAALASDLYGANIPDLVNEVAYAGRQFVILVVLTHATQRNVSMRAVRSCVLLALLLACYTVPVAWCVSSPGYAFASTWSYFWTLCATRMMILLFYLKIAISAPQSRASKGSLREYCAFACISHFLLLASDAASRSEQGNDAAPSAVLAYASLAWTSLCPVFIWRVLLVDTAQWRGLGARTCDLHNQLMTDLKQSNVRISRLQYLEERVSPQGLHLRIEMHQKLLIDFASLELKQRIGTGTSNTKVFSGVLHSRIAVAVKVYTPADFTNESLTRFSHEAALCGALHHPGIVRFYGMCIAPPNVSFATELCMANLRDALRVMSDSFATTQQNQYHFLVQLGYILDATRAVAYLHSFLPAFLHRDIKLTNFVVNHDGNVKLTHLGESRRLPPQCRSDPNELESGFNPYASPRASTPSKVTKRVNVNVGYTPPEVLCDDGDFSSHKEAVDVYALAMIMWEILHPGCEPFSGVHTSDKTTVAEAVTGGYRPKIDSRIHPYLRQLIESSWEQDARLRPSAQHIVSVLEIIQEEVMNELAGELFGSLGGQFFGEEAVQHLTRLGRVGSKGQAIRLGNALMDAGLLHHINHSKCFDVCKYGVYYIEENSGCQQNQSRRTENSPSDRTLEPTTKDETVADEDNSLPTRPSKPRALSVDRCETSPSPRVTRRGHRVESFEPDQLRLIDSTLCACRRLGQRMEEPAKLVRRTRRPTLKLLEEENTLTADLLIAGQSESHFMGRS